MTPSIGFVQRATGHEVRDRGSVHTEAPEAIVATAISSSRQRNFDGAGDPVATQPQGRAVPKGDTQ